MILQAIGVGLGVGIVHSVLLFLVIVGTRTREQKQSAETLRLMRERNSIDRQKVEALRAIGNAKQGTENDGR